MKEQTLLEMKNKVEATNRVIQQMINELMHLRELGVGTLETIKLMPGYDEAIEKLKESLTKNEKEKDELPT
jgi:peptidyl-tRNA hydrolase